MSKELIKKETQALATITSEALLTTYAPKQAMRLYSGCTSIGKALNSDAPKLTQLVRKLGIKKVETYLKVWLVDLNTILDLKKPLNEDQIDDLAFRIVDKFRSLNIADINLVFTRVKNGEVGGIYDRITVPTVMKWFNDYFNERCNTAADKSYQDHAQHKVQMRGLGESVAVTNKEKHRQAMQFHAKAQEMADYQERVKSTKKPKK